MKYGFLFLINLKYTTIKFFLLVNGMRSDIIKMFTESDKGGERNEKFLTMHGQNIFSFFSIFYAIIVYAFSFFHCSILLR